MDTPAGGGARNMEYIPRKAEQGRTDPRERAQVFQVTGLQTQHYSDATSVCPTDQTHSWGTGVCPAVFLWLIFPFYALVLSIWHGNVYNVPRNMGSTRLELCFHRALWLRGSCKFQKRLLICIFWMTFGQLRLGLLEVELKVVSFMRWPWTYGG